jgi:hypothetical protein
MLRSLPYLALNSVRIIRTIAAVHDVLRTSSTVESASPLTPVRRGSAVTRTSAQPRASIAAGEVSNDASGPSPRMGAAETTVAYLSPVKQAE